MPLITAQDDANAYAQESQLIQLLYASITHRQGFHPFLAALADFMGAASGNFCSVNRENFSLEHVWYSSNDQQAIDTYIDAYVSHNMLEHDVVLNLAVKQYPGGCQTGISALNTLKELEDATRWENSYQHFTQVLGVLDTVWMVVHASKESVFLLTINRSTPYSDEELSPIRRLMPHIRQAYSLYKEVSKAESEAHSMAAVLDGLTKPVLILNNECAIVHCNSKALALLSQEQGIRVIDEHIELSDRTQHGEFTLSLLEVIRSSMGISSYVSATHYIKRAKLSDLILCLTPIEDLDAGHGGALLSLVDPEERKLPEAAEIARYFSLTKAEARLCEDLIKGLSLDEIALLRHKSKSTLRGQLKQIFQKTGFNRQGLLISGILSALIE